MIVTKDQATEMSIVAQKKLRAFDADTATAMDLIAFCAEMEDEARRQATNLRETLAFLEANEGGQSPYAKVLRVMLPELDLILCRITDLDIKIHHRGGTI